MPHPAVNAIKSIMLFQTSPILIFPSCSSLRALCPCWDSEVHLTLTSKLTCFFGLKMPWPWIICMVQRVRRVLAAKSYYLNSTPGPTGWKEKTDCNQLSSDLQGPVVHVPWYTWYINTGTNKNVI